MIKSIASIKSKFAELNQILQFDHIKYTIEETMAVRRLKDCPGTILLIAFPDYERHGGDDNPTYEHSLAMWVLEKDNTGAIIDDEQDNDMDKLLTKIKELIDYIENRKSAGCSFFSAVNLASIEINPVYRAFGGFSGWFLIMTMN